MATDEWYGIQRKIWAEEKWWKRTELDQAYRIQGGGGISHEVSTKYMADGYKHKTSVKYESSKRFKIQINIGIYIIWYGNDIKNRKRIISLPWQRAILSILGNKFHQILETPKNHLCNSCFYRHPFPVTWIFSSQKFKNRWGAIRRNWNKHIKGLM